MIIDIGTKLKNLDGSVLTEKVKENGSETDKEITLEVVIRHALSCQLQSDQRTQKEKDFTLMIRIVTAKDGQADLSSEDISRIKEKVYTLYDALIAGQVDYLLEGKELPF